MIIHWIARCFSRWRPRSVAKIDLRRVNAFKVIALILLMLLHECGPVAGVPPGVRDVEVGRDRDQGIGGGTITTAIRRLDPSRVHALDRQLEELEFVIVALAGDADYRVQRHFHVRQLLGFLVEEESDDAAQYRLMRHYEHVVGALQFFDHRLDAMHRVDVTLTPRITITQLVLIAPGEFLKLHEAVVSIGGTNVATIVSLRDRFANAAQRNVGAAFRLNSNSTNS